MLMVRSSSRRGSGGWRDHQEPCGRSDPDSMEWRVLFRCASADAAEAMACAEGLRLASQWCPGPVVVESDSARIVKATSNRSVDGSDIGSTITEAKEYLQALVEWRIQKVKRECNKVAHELAQLARRCIHTATYGEGKRLRAF